VFENVMNRPSIAGLGGWVEAQTEAG